jgi:peptide/nickel transport system substrate-binding protein
MTHELAKCSPVRALSLSASLSAILICASAAQAQTITAVMGTPLRILDPIINTSSIARDHGYMIYDTLLATDAQNKVQPQMVDKWTVSADGKTYDFALRAGQKWHDGAPVKAEDCVASIKRWGQKDTMGQVLMDMVSELKVVDDNNFRVVLKEASPLVLQAFAKVSGPALFVMPKRVADTPSSQPIKEYIGSGPFKFVLAEFKPGVKAVYEKNKDYVPRREPASWIAGGKVVHVDRVEWVTMPDHLTTANALLNGEIDYMESVPFDLLPMVAKSKDLQVVPTGTPGYQAVYRFNHLIPPFDNKLIRQAAMHAIAQEDTLKAFISNPKYYKTCAAVFGCSSPYASNYGADMIIPANVKKAQDLLKQAKYDGTPVVLLHPTDNVSSVAQPVVMAQALRKAGFKVDLQAMDLQTMQTRRASQKPASEGGWNMFMTIIRSVDIMDPMRSYTVAANGKKAWFGWPDVPQISALRIQFARATKPAEQKRLAEEIQKQVIDEGVVVPLGEFQPQAAYSKRLTGVLESPISSFWNIKKSAK